MSTVVAFKQQTKATPNIENRKVTSRRLPNKELRKREYLTPRRIEKTDRGDLFEHPLLADMELLLECLLPLNDRVSNTSFC